nr:unknown Function [uncultured bacterium]
MATGYPEGHAPLLDTLNDLVTSTHRLSIDMTVEAIYDLADLGMYMASFTRADIAERRLTREDPDKDIRAEVSKLVCAFVHAGQLVIADSDRRRPVNVPAPLAATESLFSLAYQHNGLLENYLVSRPNSERMLALEMFALDADIPPGETPPVMGQRTFLHPATVAYRGLCATAGRRGLTPAFERDRLSYLKARRRDRANNLEAA